MKYSLFLFSLFLLHAAFPQTKRPETASTDSTATENKPVNKLQKNIPAHGSAITDYKIISYPNDTTYLDTTLTIQKDYQFNYLRTDDFELLPFSNMGQPYNRLAPAFITDLYPQLGASAKHANYMETEDISYYHVPTPLTELFFKTGMEQGQLLDAFITLNTSKQFNFSLAYKGLRSLGKYQHILSSTGNFRFTTNYRTKNDRYRLRAHIVAQDILNQENGGIVDETLFESGDSEFRDRSRIDVHFENAENLLKGKRYYVEQGFDLFRRNDSLAGRNLAIGHRATYETKFYQFNQTSADDYFGDAFQSSNLTDRAKLRTWQNELYLLYKTKWLGEWALKGWQYHYHYFFKSILYTETGVITNQLKDQEYSLGGSWKYRIAGIDLSADFTTIVSGTLGGSLFQAQAKYVIDKDKKLQADIVLSERMPDFNFLLYQSDYTAYNWQNTSVFNPERLRQIEVAFLSKKWLDATVTTAILDNHTYFSQASGGTNPQVEPFQYSPSIQYLKIKLEKELKLGKFALNNTLMYQHVTQDAIIVNVPSWVTRNTLYYSEYLFKKALYLQMGVTFKYFSEYNANAYSPLLGEFYVQNERTIGGFPMFDFFINGKVRQTRIYLKAEHFNSSFTGYNFYSAPNYPYRDFIVRFGLVWNFFL